MSQKRWDIELEFLSGHMKSRGPQHYDGPLVRIGKRPGPGGVDLSQYQGIAEVHATIQVYEGNKTVLTPIAPHEIRVAEHESADWRYINPLRKPAYLSPNNVIHVGSLDRGARIKFVKSESFEWTQGAILSAVDQSNDIYVYNEIDTQVIQSSAPKWFYPALGVMTLLFLAVIAFIVFTKLEFEDPTGIRFDGDADYELRVSFEEASEIEESLLTGFRKPFAEMVMHYNAELSGKEELKDDYNQWDDAFYKRTVFIMRELSRYSGYYKTLEKVKDDYALVIEQLRKNKFPEVFAGVPMQETRFRRNLSSPVCASGIWQFMPETAIRSGMEVADCEIKGKDQLWTPELQAPLPTRRSPYVTRTSSGGYSCRIANKGRCGIDERFNLEKSTDAAVRLFKETYNDDELRESGAIVQMAIIAHNCGYDDGKFDPKAKKKTNVLPSYRSYMATKGGAKSGHRFYGDNIKCGKDKDPHKAQFYSDRCGGFIPNQSQHYGYHAVAKHMVAVCYYAKNHGSNPIFEPWKKYLSSDGYCTLLNTPTKKQLKLYK